MKIEAYLRYQDVVGAASTVVEFEAMLRSLDLGLVLRLFGAINTVCSRRGHPENQAAQIGLSRELFDPPTVQVVERSGQAVFHRRQCLFVLREAMRVCPDIPNMEVTAEVRQRIGLVALMANEHASSTAVIGQTQDDVWLARMCDFIPVTEANELKFDLASISRMHKIVNDLAPARAGEKGYFEIASLFGETSGLPLRLFEQLTLAILPRVLQSAVDLMSHSPHYGVRVDYFAETSLEAKHRDIFFGLLSKTPDEFRSALQGTAPLLSDFTLLKDKPFLRNPDRLVPLDTTACMEKFEATVFWTIHKHLPSSDQKIVFTSFWAKLFEDYVHWLLKNSVDQNLNRFYPSPRYAASHKEEVCDGIVICGTTAIFIECKGGFIRGDAKYGGDPEKLKTELEKKYVKPKGVFQIARAISVAFDQSQLPAIDGVDLSGVRTVIPLLITRDEVGDGFFVNAYLDRRFTEARKGLGLDAAISPVHCTPLLSIAVDTIEKLTPYLSDTRLAAILVERLRLDPLLLVPFFLKGNAVLAAKGPDRPPTLLRAITEELKQLVAAFLKPVSDAPGKS